MRNLALPFLLLLASVLLLTFCTPKEESNVGLMEEVQNPELVSWNEGPTKQAIIDYVMDVTNPSSSNFIPVEDRIATFDNDGNLWSEQPAYFQLFFAIDRVKALASEHPEWSTQQPFKSVLENDMKTLSTFGEHGLLELVMASHTGMSTEEFEQIVIDWLETSRHPRFDRPFNELIYQPMLELLDYLRANEFKTFIVSGGGIEFMRPWVDEAYGIPSDQVVGSSIATEFDYNNGNPIIKRIPKIDFIDDKEGKPIGINRFIGKKPVFASGNSDGDLQMLQWTDSNKYKSFQLYLHHTDAEREWAYDKNSSIGRLDKGLEEALNKGWTVVDMKKDWKVIYPFEMK
ncbi:HAD family hydrolase [Algoriphagus halophilus]|uniref:phosphoserine phosphatase n=1 Tax=Algoriphagus halophilus TaxID=226505 RepID=A0A1N6GAJ3_9BACT|nr:HAD family hydrolase [Algoriphagus halophilus]SIO04471.1 Phosphoserine phosphatase [Algoriphagus halophilus]